MGGPPVHPVDVFLILHDGPSVLLALAERWNLAGSARRLVDALSGDPA